MRLLQDNFKFVDLFCGIGGFHLAMQRLGGECVLACDIDPENKRVYEAKFNQNNKIRFVNNIRELTRREDTPGGISLTSDDVDNLVPNHDVLCGGFPCQPFSKSGKQEGNSDKTRGTLFHDILQIINAKRPKIIFLENVKNLAGPRHIDTWNTIKASIGEMGYHVATNDIHEPLVFSPHWLSPDLGGRPQARERVFILAVRKDIEYSEENVANLVASWDLLRKRSSGDGSPVLWDTNSWDLTDYLDHNPDIKYDISPTESKYFEAWGYFLAHLEQTTLPGTPIWVFALKDDPEIHNSMALWEKRFRIFNSNFYKENKKFIDSWKNMKWGDKAERISDFPRSRQILEWQADPKSNSKTKGKVPLTTQDRDLSRLIMQLRPSGIRVKRPTYAPALVAITQTTVLGSSLSKKRKVARSLTPEECCRLQGFPDNFFDAIPTSDRIKYRQLGNAVCVTLVERIMGILIGSYPPLRINNRRDVEWVK